MPTALRFVTRSLLLGLALAASACDSRQPTLISAVFLDGASPDGHVSQGEAIVLTFSEPVRLRGSSRSGVQLHPEDHALGFFEVRHASDYKGENGTSYRLRSHQLVVVVKGGDRKVVAQGRYGVDETATGISVDFGALGVLAADLTSIVGQSGVVDLAVSEHDPAALVAATWIDTDGSGSVSLGDELELTWDRLVSIGEPIRTQRNEVPDDLFALPVHGDRLDDGRVPSRLEKRTNPHSLYVVLGSSPRFSPAGTHDDSQLEIGSPSGLAVRGTPIRRHSGIQDALCYGVADQRAIDLAGGLLLFAPIRVPVGFESEMVVDHTATPLPGGKVLITGGMVPGPENRRPVVYSSAYIFDVAAGEWSAPIRMKRPRWGHTASYFSGLDGREGSEDDFVIVAGGWNDNNVTQGSVEIIFPFAERPEFQLCEEGAEILRRANHTAHALALESWDPSASDRCGSLILVGGYTDRSLLNGVIEAIDIRIQLTDNGYRAEVSSRPIERLAFPRAHHDSILVELAEGPALFVYGGWGDEGVQINPEAWTCEALAAPELFTLDDRSNPLLARPERLPVTAAPGPRVSPKLVPLLEERGGILLVGGASERNAYDRRRNNSEQTRLDLETAYRIDIVIGREPALEFQRAGSMIAPRIDFATAVLPTGQVLVIGGESDGRAVSRVEVFDPMSNECEIYGTRLGIPRRKLTTTPLTEDEWLIMGGGAGGEIYNRPEG